MPMVLNNKVQVNLKELHRTVNDYAEERRIYEDLISFELKTERDSSYRQLFHPSWGSSV